MEPLNPDAPPFYPSRFHYLRHVINPPPRPPHPPPPYQPLRPLRTANQNKTVCYYSLSPLPKGPRITFTNINLRGGNKKFREIIPLNRNENITSVMIRNIPNGYTRELLVEFLEKHCKNENVKEENNIHSAFDFVYLPVDFKHKLNAGYAFVNFTTCEAAWKFSISLKGKKWDLFQSKKIAEVSRARIQGKDALVKNFERMKLCSPSADYLPVWFEPPRDGCGLGSTPSTMKVHTIGVVRGS